MRVADFIVNYIEKIGVEHVFGLFGGNAMYLFDAVTKNKNITFVPMLTEQAAIIAANAYSQINGNIGVVFCTSGPGSTNAITGVAASWIDSTPLLIISGQCKSADLNNGSLRQKGCQEVDIISMVRGITKFAVQLTPQSNVRVYLEYAIKVAKQRRSGPVWLDITLDAQAAEI